MSFDATTRAAQLPALAAPPRFVLSLMQAVASMFRLSAPVAQERTIHLWWVAALVCTGAFFRFWGLGNVGLHGDEETMAMAVRHILIDGSPILPSGMFYPRGMAQLYLMALSVSMFGESEWVLRLPSALCGIALVGICFFVGRRFLRPEWNVAFVASVALLPELIVYSQTARMYIFLVTCVAGSMACLFAWESTGRTKWLIGAIAVLILGLDMQVLAVSAVLMFLLPGVVRSDAHKLWLGAVAAAVVTIAFVLVDGWVGSYYPVPPPEFTAALGPQQASRNSLIGDFPLVADLGLWAAGATVAFFVFRVTRCVSTRVGSAAVAAMLIAGIALQLALSYHLAVLCFVAGGALAVRDGSPATLGRVMHLLLAAAALALAHAILLAPAADSFIQLVGAMIGQPSVWPYVRLAQLSIAAGLIVGVLLGWGLWRFARSNTIPDYWLFALLVVWAPVFALGAFAWNIPPRYTAVALIPMLVCAFAAAQGTADWIRARMPAERSSRKKEAIGAALVAICVVNPVQAAAVINAGYERHPDHKGVAEFIAAQNITEDDIVLAEDVLQQTYYLGKVDYWLIGPPVARRFVMSRNDEVVDFYTGTPVIVTQAMLDILLLKNADKRIFVIVSGEDQENGRRFVRGPELHAAIESSRFEVIHVGRDGLSKVLRAVPQTALTTSDPDRSLPTTAPESRTSTAQPSPVSQ